MKWIKIKDFSLYEASEDGRIRSTNYKRTGLMKDLKPAINKQGYPATMLLRDDGKYCSKPIHYFITLAFYGYREDGLTVNHKDGNKQNNSISNLEYCTRSENCLHAVRTGLWEIKHGSKNGNSKLTESDVIAIRKHANENGRYYGRKKLAEQYNVSEAHIKDIVTKRRNTWKYV
jgi:hypothetical protein